MQRTAAEPQHARGPGQPGPEAPLHPLLHRFPPEKVVVFRALQLGDMLCAVPALRALRRALPHATITLAGPPWAVGFAERFCAYIDDFVTFPGHPALPEQPAPPAPARAFDAAMRARRFELALQLHGDGSATNAIVAQWGARHTAGFVPAGHPASPGLWPYPDEGSEATRLLALLAHLGAREFAPDLEFPLLEADRAELARFGATRSLPRGPYLCLHPGARAENKRWPAEGFAAVGDALHRETGWPVVITGSGEESALAERVAKAMEAPALTAAAPFSVGALAALLSGARLLVCNDTGVSHLAAALRLPSVVIFSASDMERWAPLDTRLHRRVWDPEGRGVDRVLGEARELIRGRSI